MIDDGHTVTGFFYNPNIHPFEEYRNRRDALIKYAEIKPVEVVYHDEYKIEEFLKNALASKNRCEYCYMDRLDRTASVAAEKGFEAFTSTLLISPYQQHDLIKKLVKQSLKSTTYLSFTRISEEGTETQDDSPLNSGYTARSIAVASSVNMKDTDARLKAWNTKHNT